MKLEAGMYVRTKEGLIFKIEKYLKRKDNIQLFYKDCKVKIIKNIDEIKASNNIIDLIEVGDYVNGECVYSVARNIENHYVCVETGILFNDKIYSIVTKEQFESISYRVEE